MVQSKWGSRLVPAVGLGLMTACSLGEMVTPLDSERRPGTLLLADWPADIPLNVGNGTGYTWTRQPEPADVAPPQVLSAPDTVQAGQAFLAVTYTVGPSGCWRSDGQTVQTLGRTIVLKPYDAHSGAEVCTEALKFMDHPSTVVLDEPGEWTLRVDGRRVRYGDDVWEEPVSAERTVVVQ